MSIPDQTYYRATATRDAAFPLLKGKRKARVCVVGAGYAGLATALGLIERGVHDVVVLEAQQVGYGASGRNGGFVFAGYSLGEAALLRALGPERAKRVYGYSVSAVNLIRARVQRHAIACDAVDEGVLWTNWFHDARVLRERADLLRDYFDTRWDSVPQAQLRTLVATERYGGALWERNALHLHPLNLAIGLAQAIANQGGHVFEQSPALGLRRAGEHWEVGTSDGVVEADHVVLSCGGYLAGLHRAVDRSILPIATYVVATEPLGGGLNAIFPGTRAAVYDSRFAFDYYRPLPDTRLLWGGRISVCDRAPTEVARLLKRDMTRVFPSLRDARVDYAWSGLMSYARHQMPQIRTLEPGLWCAQGFGGHGVATTTAGGELLAAAIAQGDRGYRDFDGFGMPSAFKPFGFAAAQATYWAHGWRDALKDWTERRLL